VHVILGIDAAWTKAQPSGLALVAGKSKAWRCLCVAPSYERFIACASGATIDWDTPRFAGTAPDIDRLLSAARALAGTEPTVIAVDMPMADVAFSGRRAADQAISEVYGAVGCSTHSPTCERPGRLGVDFTEALRRAGYPLATCAMSFEGKRAIEVFPHPALLVLLGRNYRVPYKVSKSTKYWKDAPIQNRIVNLLAEFHSIKVALERHFGPTDIDLPATSGTKLAHLKRYEDALDALSCAWVATRCIEGTAAAYGDETSAIWVPQPLIRAVGNHRARIRR
jgi:predicted RNase H-like nuclease